MQIPILNGIGADAARPDFRTVYPRNMVPVPKMQGISNGYLRPSEGIVTLNAATPGVDRGGIVRNKVGYRVMGTQLCVVTTAGTVDVLGDVGGAGYVSMDYSFTAIGFASGGYLWYSSGDVPVRVTDADIGNVLDACFVAGYWVFTDGDSIGVTEINNPMAVNPLRYGSSEVDPDPVVALRRIRDEFYAINRFTIEGFRNIGGTGFPFQPIDGSQVLRGAVGRSAVCVFESALGFVGSGRNEGVSVYLAENGNSISIATREIEQVLEQYDDNELATVVLEPRLMRGHKFLYVHLPDQTLVYDATSSLEVEEPVWHLLSSGTTPQRLRMWGFMLLNNQWVAGDPTSSKFGVLSSKVMTHFDDAVGWEFGVPAMYGDGNGAIIHELELVALPGRVSLGADPVIWTSSSEDGTTWSHEVPIKAGKIGQRNKRLVWISQGRVQNWRTQRFRGNSDATLAFARLEARIEPLNMKRGNGA